MTNLHISPFRRQFNEEPNKTQLFPQNDGYYIFLRAKRQSSGIMNKHIKDIIICIHALWEGKLKGNILL